MRHIVLIVLFLLLANQAFGQDNAASSTLSKQAHTRSVSNMSSGTERRGRSAAIDELAPALAWGKKAPKESAPHVCNYDGAMSDEDIAICRSR